jgi:hypothetical protein
VYDYATAKKSALPSFMSERFRETWEAQEREKERCGEKVKGLESRVRILEEGSWKREGAVEDLGSAVESRCMI